MWTAKIQRAEEHQVELVDLLSKFLSAKPYSIGTKIDPHSKRLVYYVQEARDVPDKIALVAGDVIQNLRSALDHLAYQLFLKNSSESGLGKHIYFPISDSEAKYNSEKKSKTKGLSDKTKKLFDRVKPYKGGNNLLWQINELNLIDKHRMLITVGAAFQSLSVDFGSSLSKI